MVPGDDPGKPRPDLHRPWRAITRRAGLEGVRLHDLRHTYASFGAGSGLGLPIIGRLLGHTQAATTARYAHLDNDPLRRASEAIGGKIAAALEGTGIGGFISTQRLVDRRCCLTSDPCPLYPGKQTCAVQKACPLCANSGHAAHRFLTMGELDDDLLARGGSRTRAPRGEASLESLWLSARNK